MQIKAIEDNEAIYEYLVNQSFGEDWLNSEPSTQQFRERLGLGEPASKNGHWRVFARPDHVEKVHIPQFRALDNLWA